MIVIRNDGAAARPGQTHAGNQHFANNSRA